jgi:glyoxylase-like metal-dependent hydrolase (beta-lactamase superfamily II)
MATAAEPRQAELPLPGGREGARVRLHPLLSGSCKGPKAWFLREEGRLAWRHGLGFGVPKRDWLTVPVPAFLVEHPGAGRILIDTGFHPSVAAAPRANLGWLSQFTFRGIEMKPDQAVPAQLRARGIEPDQVKVVVMTHMHIDHASAVSEFPGSTFVVSAAEWAAASEHGQFHGYVKRQFDHGFDWRLLDFEGADTESFSGFARSFDLFGDGSVRAVYTPGHTLGHLSVVLRTERGEVLVAGDAIYLRRTLDDNHLPYRTADEHLFRRSLREIRQYATETPEALIVPGHDWEAWHELEAVY